MNRKRTNSRKPKRAQAGRRVKMTLADATRVGRRARDASSHVPRKQLERGLVVWALVPYMDDPAQGKLRPAIVLGPPTGHFVDVAPVYTRRPGLLLQEVSHWEACGLSRPAGLVPGRRMTLDVNSCYYTLGTLDPADEAILPPQTGTTESTAPPHASV